MYQVSELVELVEWIDAKVLGVIWCQFQQRYQQKQLAKSTATTTTRRNKQLFPCQLHQDESFFPLMINIISCANKNIMSWPWWISKFWKKLLAFQLTNRWYCRSPCISHWFQVELPVLFSFSFFNCEIDFCWKSNSGSWSEGIPGKFLGKVCWGLQNVVNLLV